MVELDSASNITDEGKDIFEASQAFDTVEVECDSVNFILGENFSSYEQLKEKISAYEDGNNIQLVYNNTRTLEAAKRRAPKRVNKEKRELVYYSLQLTCLFGGKTFHSKGSGQRPH